MNNRQGSERHGHDGLKSTWPIHRREAGLLAIGYLVLVGVWTGIGALITGPLEPSALTRADQRIAQWLVDHRTSTWNHLTVWGSFLAETITKVVVTAVLAIVLVRVWKRYFEPMVLVVSLVIEAAAFIVVTHIVGRGRPDVVRLDNSPVNSSFPSGHVAASMAYIAITVIIFWHTRRRWPRFLSVIVTALIPIIVGVSRMYRGMHYFSDVVGGALLGGAAVLLTVTVLRRSTEGINAVGQPADTSQPEDTARPGHIATPVELNDRGSENEREVPASCQS